MPSYINPESNKAGFSTRYAKAVQEKAESRAENEKAEFDAGYRSGKLRYAVASRHMNFKSAGLDRYLENKDDGLSVIWKREGDQIIRLDSDTSWIDDLLKLEGNR